MFKKLNPKFPIILKTQLGTGGVGVVKIENETQLLTVSQLITRLNYKPKGIVTNCKQYGETEITDLLPKKFQHLNSIGRLDKDSEGLIILTE